MALGISAFTLQLASLAADFKAGTLSESAYALALADLWAQYDSVLTLSDNIAALIERNDTIVAALRFMQPTGTVSLVSSLPDSAGSGEFWVVTGGASADHGFLRIGGAWQDMGVVRGPAGPTPQLTIGTITTVAPTEPAEAVLTGTAENPILNLVLPRGANARTGMAMSAAYLLEPGELLASWVADDALTFDPATSRAVALAAATSTAVVAIKKNGVAWGTATWTATHTTGVVALVSNTIAAGDVLTFYAPASADPTLASIAITLAGAST